MKPYFAKYLPVEGQIKIGYGEFMKQKYLFHGGTLYEHFSILNNFDPNTHTFGIPPGQKHGKHLLISECSLAQLFLCSRDIQVGDKFYSSELHNIDVDMPASRIIDDFIFNGSSLRFKREFCFKVIGLISPEATWVKEGDEFEESQLGWLELADYAPEDETIVRSFQHNPNRHKLIGVAIKGPCGHFH